MDNHFSQSIYAESRQTSVFSAIFIPFSRPIRLHLQVEFAKDNMQDKTIIKQELSEILAKYYDGSFTRLVQEYIRTSSMKEEEREGLMETMRSLNQHSL